jgi:hypothetical protein
MGKRGAGLRIAAVAVLVAAAVTIPAAATTAAPSPSLAEVRALLVFAIADEKRALELLRKKPPRVGTAQLALKRSRERLDAILRESTLPFWARDHLLSASFLEASAVSQASSMAFFTTGALQHKETAMDLLRRPATVRGPQCANGVDDDRDGTEDAKRDSGCTDKKDKTERGRLSSGLVVGQNGASMVVEGQASGPFARIEIRAPAGNRFDTRREPNVRFSRDCRFASPRKLECVMEDGQANPRHVVSARFRLISSIIASRLSFVLFDFGGRRHSVALEHPTLRFKLSYFHFPRTHVCISIEASPGAFLELTIEGPNGFRASGTLQLRQEQTTGHTSVRIPELGTYGVTITETVGGRSVTKTQTIAVTEDPGDPRCSETGAGP